MTKIIKKDLKIRLYWHLQNYVIHLHYNEGIKIMHFICLGFRRAPPGEIRQLQMDEVYLAAWTTRNREDLWRASQSSINPLELIPVQFTTFKSTLVVEGRLHVVMVCTDG